MLLQMQSMVKQLKAIFKGGELLLVMCLYTIYKNYKDYENFRIVTENEKCGHLLVNGMQQVFLDICLERNLHATFRLLQKHRDKSVILIANL